MKVRLVITKGKKTLFDGQTTQSKAERLLACTRDCGGVQDDVKVAYCDIETGEVIDYIFGEEG